MAQRPQLTASAAASRAATVMRRIDQGALCAGCGEAGPWLCERVCPWSWLWAVVGTIPKRYIITLQESIDGTATPG